MKQKLEEIRARAEAELQKIDSLADLEALRVQVLGKKGELTAILKSMGSLSAEERPKMGQLANEVRQSIEAMLTEKTKQLKEEQMRREIEATPVFDVSAPVDLTRGSYHPITLVQRECERIFKSMGFTVEDYSEIVTDYECFESLNIPKAHPARDMQDTYYLENGQLLKTQTSAAQNAIYKKYKDALINDGVPIKAIFPGR